MGSDEAQLIHELLKEQNFAALTLDEQRAAVGPVGPPPEGTTIEEVTAAGVPCQWVTAPTAADERGVVVSLRGGGYCLGSLTSNEQFSGLLSQAAARPALNVGYRNAPEHRYPAALDDAIAAYRWLLRTGFEPTKMVLAGNSAGAGLALGTLLALKDAGDPLPACAVVISPWTDLAATGDSITANAATEVMLDPAGIGDTAALYADARQLTDPYVSPLYGDLAGLPPLLIQASGAEILRDDSIRFAQRAQAAEVDVTLEVVPDMVHVWHLFAGFLPEADQAWRSIQRWLTRVL